MSFLSNNLTNYGRWHSKLFTNCHVSWDTLYYTLRSTTTSWQSFPFRNIRKTVLQGVPRNLTAGIRLKGRIWFFKIIYNLRHSWAFPSPRISKMLFAFLCCQHYHRLKIIADDLPFVFLLSSFVGHQSTLNTNHR